MTLLHLLVCLKLAWPLFLFQENCECRFMFPFTTCAKTYIHENRWCKYKNEILWHNLYFDEIHRKMAPLMIITKQQMGCQYANNHNPKLSAIFNFHVSKTENCQPFFVSMFPKQGPVSNFWLPRLQNQEQSAIVGFHVSKT